MGGGRLEFVAEAAALRAAASRVAKVVPGSPQMPELGAVLVEADGDRVALTATDVQVWLTMASPAEVLTPGASALPCRAFASLCGELEGTVRVRCEEDGVLVGWKSGRWVLNRFDPGAFPKPPAAGGVELEVPAAELAAGLAQVLPAASKDEGQGALAGVAWDPDGWLVATDAVRLAARRFVPFRGTGLAVLPRGAASLLASCLPDRGSVKVVLSTTFASFAWEGGCLTARLLGQRYPNWRQVATVSPAVAVRARVEDLIACFERAVAAAGDDFPAVVVRLGAGALEVEGKSTAARTREEVPCACVSGGSLEVRFNASLVLDGLKASRKAGAEEVHWGFAGEEAVSVLEAGDSYRYLVLPLRKS